MFREVDHEEAILRLMRILKEFLRKLKIALCLSQILNEEKVLKVMKSSEKELFHHICDSYNNCLQKNQKLETFEEFSRADPNLTLLLEILYQYPETNVLTEELIGNTSFPFNNVINCVNTSNKVVEERIRTTPSQQRKYKLQLRNASATLNKSKAELKPLKNALDEQRKKHLEFVSGISEEIRKCQAIIKDTQLKHEVTIQKILSDSESEIVGTYIEMREKQEALENQIEIHGEEYKKLLEECANREKVIREAHLNSEKQLMSSVINYDTVIFALYQRKEELSSDLSVLKMDFANLQEAYNAQAVSYATLKEEKEEALRNAFVEKLANFSRNRAAKIIQKTWRDYRVRMLSKKKKKSKKNKTPRR